MDNLYGGGNMMGGWQDPAYVAWQKQQSAQAKADAATKAAGGYKMNDGKWYMPDQVERDATGNLVVKGKPGIIAMNADGSPVRPEGIQVVDQNGNLKENQGVDYQTLDPNSLEGYNMLKNLATQQGPTDMAKAQMNQAEIMKSQGLDQATANASGAAAQARAGLAMRGGASSGARSNLARQSMKDILSAKQGVNAGYTGQMASIGSEDAGRKLNLMKDFGQAEGSMAAGNLDIQNKEAEFNKQLQGYGIENANKYRMDAYTAELDKWGAGKQADATRNSSSGGGGGGGCCFIFLEARYGNGTMDSVVRRFRDENMNPVNQRGYYKLSEVLVPLMRKSKLIKVLVQFTMCSPLVAYGKAHYGTGSKLGFIFAPIKNFWLKTFEYLGQDHEFVRENGEVV